MGITGKIGEPTFFTADIVEVVVTCFRFRTGNKNQLIKKAMDEKSGKNKTPQKTRTKERKRKKLKQVSDLTVCFSNFKMKWMYPKEQKTHQKNLNQIKKVIYHLKNDNKLIRKPRCSL